MQSEKKMEKNVKEMRGEVEEAVKGLGEIPDKGEDRLIEGEKEGS